ncbi:TIGR04282 family arsenosugar biosynthesis glycosyltransferase [Ideonella sp. A 288]|uniref:TIGR04282 family arsenosugar biosynthesis glycosyltransferase n=1 Tax=Ideonella sp. A 288 TaxID=1962181 RepID=UPI000B4AA0FC|nr:TIGR04282 family arsenosugar biosynthesis glycosyltransferase [Ideonella sp. A 288]
MTGAVAIVVMAKAPVPGLAKTRLIPALGRDGAAALAERLLRHTVAQACAAAVGPVDLCTTPDTTPHVTSDARPAALHPAFQELAATGQVALSQQGEGDLGQRMARAIDRHLARGRCVLLMGTDLPALDAAVLRHAAAALATHDAVVVPALDGGYGLVGLRRPAPSLFEGIAWSTPQVMQQTRERLAAAGLRHTELAPLADIDEPADLAHLPPGWLA